MQAFRKVLFWTHLVAGVAAGIVILIMSLTGVLLMYEKQMIAWADRAAIPVQAAGGQALPLERLLERTREERKALPASITKYRDDGPLAFAYGRDTVYVDPYSGSPAGVGNTSVRAFFRTVTDWHRWLAAGEDSRAAGRAVTGASNLLFLFIVASGIYLWMPRVWSRASVRAISWFRGGLTGKARDFNWHNAIGIWCAIPLLLIVASGAVISYPWASDLVYQLAGTAPPPALKQKQKQKQKKGGERGVFPGQPPADLNVEGFGALLAKAESKVPDWKTITLRLPANDRMPAVFLIDTGYAGQPQKRGTLTLDRETGEERSWETFDNLDAGRRARSWLRFVHTGEYYGLFGQTVAGIASAGGVVLVWTGISLALRRWAAWRSRKKRVQTTDGVTANR